MCVAGALYVRNLVTGDPALDVQIYPEFGNVARVVISWLDGPTLEHVEQRLSRLPELGVRMELARSI